MSQVLAGRAAIGVFACFAWAYLLAYAVRSVGAIIAPDLRLDLGLSHADLGLLTAGYFIGIGMMQLPLGLLLDRYGARQVQIVLLLIAIVGALTFAFASSFAMLWVGRALIGVGGAASLMAAYKVFAERFPPQMLPRLSAWVLVAGSGGALLATMPTMAAMPVIGWRGVFVVFALLVAIAVWMMARYAPPPLPPAEGARPTLASQIGGFKTIFTSQAFWLIVPISMMTNGGFMAVQGLWAGPWLSDVGGLDPMGIATALLFFNLTLMVGHSTFGAVVIRLEARGITLRSLLAGGAAAGLMAVGWLALGGGGAWPALPWMAWALSMSTSSLTFVLLVRAFPAALAGRASTALNQMVFLGAFMIQWGIGVLLDASVQAGLSRAVSFQLAFVCVWILQFLALMCLLFGPRIMGRNRALQA